MTSPKYAVAVNYVRHYFNPNKFNGQPEYLSITHVAGAIEKPQLIWWAAGETATEAVYHQEHWMDRPDEEAWKYLRGIHNTTKNTAADKGTDLHQVAEDALSGKPVSAKDQARPKVRGLLKFLREVKPQPELLESSVYSDRHKIAGTFDFRGRLAAVPEAGDSLVDWKAGKGVYPDFAIQLAGYGLVAEYRLADDGTEHQWQPPHSYFLAHILDDDYELHPVNVGEAERRAFLGCLEIRRWQKLEPIGQPLPHETPLNVEWVKAKIRALDHQSALELSELFTEAGIPTRPVLWTPEQEEAAVNLVRVYEMTQEKETEHA